MYEGREGEPPEGCVPTIGETFFASDRASWRAWLEEHHASAREIWLVLLKKHVREPCISLDAAVEEALCFGWIDGLLKRIDDRRHALRFTPRRPGGSWSALNKARVKRLERAGRMTEAGLAAVRAARRSGKWQAADARERVDEIPDDLAQALGAAPRAAAGFARFAPSHRKQYLHWIGEAKRSATRARRIAAVVVFAAQGKPPGIDMRIGEATSPRR
jgi:uncharacterized protein YdeI (YjbR/CyaY-like superfamily)